MSGRQRLHGFTLIELLVVVAIIAVLISILLPSLKGARDQAKLVLCTTNLKSQGEAVRFYAEDHNGWIIRGIHDYMRANEWTSYGYSLLKYLPGSEDLHVPLDLWDIPTPPELAELYENVPFYQCPSHPVPEQPLDYISSAIPIPYTQGQMDIQGFMGDRGDTFRGEYPDSYISAYQLDKIATHGPGDLVHVVEGHTSLPTDEMRYHHFFFGTQLPFAPFPRMANDGRHNGRIGCLFWDGHTEAMQMRQLDVGWPNDPEVRMRWITRPIRD